MKKIPSPPGVFDIIPLDEQETWRSSYLWQHIESVIRDVADNYGYREIRTPIFERAELFQRGVGETSDIVSKEMYLFEDKGKRIMSLRPEGTAPVMRAFTENGLQNQGQIHKLFYIGPMFRYDRPQAGRYRQHHQFGIEAIGNRTPEQDAEIIDFLHTVYSRLGLKNLKFMLNCLGTNQCRITYREKLQDYLRPHFEKLSEDSQKRFDLNPLRILDSKDPSDREIIKEAPSILDFIDDASREYFQAVRANLDALNIPYEVDPNLVRGLDYYNMTVFEIVAGELGAQNSIGGGGRYDGLLPTLGGPDLPAMGFGAGIERTLQTMIKQKVELPAPPSPLVYFIPLGDIAKAEVFKWTHELRLAGISVHMDFTGKKLGKLMQHADQMGAKFTAVVGDEELASEEIELKEMSTGETIKIPVRGLKKVLTIEEKMNEYKEVVLSIEEPFESASEKEFYFKRLKREVEKTQEATDSLYAKIQEMKKLVE